MIYIKSRFEALASLNAFALSQLEPWRPSPGLFLRYRIAMPTTRYRGPRMTLANMRENCVRSLWVVCAVCHHEAVLNVDGYDEDVAVPSFGPRMVCTCCGIIGADVRPNWSERPKRDSLTGWH